MYVSSSTSVKVTNEAEIDKAVDELRRVIQGSLLVDTYEFELTLSFTAHEPYENEESDEPETLY